MLREQRARSPDGGLHRRWFADDFFDLYVWAGAGGEIVRFELCYGKPDAEHALTWSPGGFSHHAVDPGEDDPTRNMTPVLVPDGAVPWMRLHERFLAQSSEVPPDVRRFVLGMLTGTPDGVTRADSDRAAPTSPPPEPAAESRAAARSRLAVLALAAIIALAIGWLALRSLLGHAPDALIGAGNAAATPSCATGCRGVVFDLPQRTAAGVWLFTLIEDSGTLVVVLTEQPASEVRMGDRVLVTGSQAEVGPAWVVLEGAVFARVDR